MTVSLDTTHDPLLRSWLASANDPPSDVPIQNLPFGRFRRADDMDWRIGVAIGDHVLDLRLFNTIGSISYDHPDPSIFLVLHSASDTAGVSSIDFVIFPPRILVMQDTFRPPWFHRNIASEFMGLIHGAYDAKAEGFVPGGASLHNSMTGHGPDAQTFEKASRADTSKADVIADTMAFMFESRAVWRPTRHAIESAELQDDYFRCWQGLQKHFDPRRP